LSKTESKYFFISNGGYIDYLSLTYVTKKIVQQKRKKHKKEILSFVDLHHVMILGK
jgi:hypothetical protein